MSAQGGQASGQKLTEDRLDIRLGIPLENSPEFATGWRELPLSRMTVAEVSRFFDELRVLVLHGGVEH